MRTSVKVAIGFVSAIVLIAAGLAVGERVKSPQQAAAEAKPPPPSIVTANVELRSLIDTFVTRGRPTKGGGFPLAAPDGVPGPDSVVTAVKTKPGAQLQDGQVILEVSGEPLIVATLPFRMYRDLHIGDRGPDVQALSSFLRSLRYLSTTSDTATAATQIAVRKLLADRGYGRLMPAVGGDPILVVKQRWILRTDRSGRTVARVGVDVGSDIAAPAAVLIECDATPPVVEARVDTAASKRIKPGAHATVVDETNNRSVAGSVASVDGAPTTDPLSGAVGYLVTVVADPPGTVAGLPDNLRVTLESVVDASAVPAVPTTAVYTDETGSSHVVLAVGNAEGPSVAVRLGPCVSGWCQILSSDVPLPPGTKVVVGMREERSGG